MKRAIICFPAIDWHYLFHRPQQLMLRLAKAGHPVHIRNPGQIPGAAPEEVGPHLWVYPDFDKMPAHIGNQAIYFIYFPVQVEWIEAGTDKFIIYDCIDDDPVFDGAEELILGRADLILCVSDKLQQKFTGKNKHIMRLSNGVDLQHYLAENEPLPPEMQEIKSKGALIIGFSGAFFRGWVDIELVYNIAQSHPEWRIVIIGESYHWDFSGAPSNLIYLGRKSYQVLPAYVRGFDVGLIPFLDNRISQGADPVKLYEYIAAGIPVVSRKLPFVEHLNPPLVYSYNNPQECLTMIIQALIDSQQNKEAHLLRLNFAASNTWDSKAELLLKELASLTWV